MHSSLMQTIVVTSTLALTVASACGPDRGEEVEHRRSHPDEHPTHALQEAVGPATILDANGNLHFHDVRAQTHELIGYYDSIELTPDQQRVKEEALGALPAPCCSRFSALTCCCQCNISRSVWGLSHYLIARGQDAGQVRAAVQSWLAFVSPSGHSGQSCFNGGCNRPFAEDGCGGMSPEHVVFGS